MNWIGWLALVAMASYMAWGMLRGSAKTVREFAITRHGVGHTALWATLIASWSSAFTLFSPAEMGFTNGVQGLYWHAYLNMGLFAAVPVIMAIKRIFPQGTTLPQYLGERFNLPSRVIASLAVIAFGIVEGAAIVFLGATTLQVLGGVPFMLGAVLIGGSYLLYTMFGGLGAVIMTDVLRLLTYVWLAILVVPAVIITAGGTSEIYRALLTADVESDQLLRATPWVMLTFLVSHMAAAAYGPLWQRTFAARSTKVVDYLAPGWYFGWVPFAVSGAVLGIVAKAFLTDQLGGPSEAIAGSIQNFAPGWAQAVFIVGFLAILLSTADTNINTAVSVWCIDIHGLIRPNASDRLLLLTGRIVALVMATVAFLLGIYFVDGALQFLTYIFNSLAALVPPIMLGIFWRRITGSGAFLGMLLGSATTVGMLLAGYGSEPLGGLLSFLVPMGVAAVVCIAVSLLRPEPVNERLVLRPTVGRRGFRISTGWSAMIAFLLLASTFPFYAELLGLERMNEAFFTIFMWLPPVGGVTLLLILLLGRQLDRAALRAGAAQEAMSPPQMAAEGGERHYT